MIDEIRALVDEYHAWLREKTTLRQINGWTEITTPYIDRHNDRLQIYAKRQNGGYLLTDDGYVLQDLEQSGCRIEGGRRQALLAATLNGFGVRRADNGYELQVHASADNFALRKHNLLQAMLAVDDLFYLAQPVAAGLFQDDVVEWLDASDIRYTPNAKFTGASGYDHLFPFVIPKSSMQPERMLRVINRPGRANAQSLAFAWIDTKNARPEASRAYAILNDSEREAPSGVIEAMRSYDIKPIVWSERERVREELAA